MTNMRYGQVVSSGSGGEVPPALTSSAYYRRMRLHTASTLDLPVRYTKACKLITNSNTCQDHQSNESPLLSRFQIVSVPSKDLRTSTLAWLPPLPTLILHYGRWLETKVKNIIFSARVLNLICPTLRELWQAQSSWAPHLRSSSRWPWRPCCPTWGQPPTPPPTQEVKVGLPRRWYFLELS